MNSDLFFDNQKYISAKQASLIAGYTSDYVGQLCRNGKLLSKRIGKSWYVSEKSLFTHLGKPLPKPVPVTAPDEIIQGDEKYISAKRASGISGYASDYIGQLSRAGKLVSKRIGKSWYVSEKSLASYIAETSAMSQSNKHFKTISRVLLPERTITSTIAETLSDIAHTAKVEGEKIVEKAVQPAYVHYPTVLSYLSDSAKNHQSFIYESLLKKLIFGTFAVFLSFGLVRAFSDVVTNPTVLGGVVAGNMTPLVATVHESVSRDIGYPVLSMTASVGSVFSTIGEIFSGLIPSKQTVIVNNTYNYVATTSPVTVTKTVVSAPAQKQSSLVSVIPQTKTIIQKITEQPIIQGVSRAELQKSLDDLNGNFSSRFSALSSGSSGAVTNIYQEIASSQKIDKLFNTLISSPSISGGSISGASISATGITANSLSVSGAISFATTTLSDLTISTSTAGCAQFSATGELFSTGTDCGTGFGGGGGAGTFATSTSQVAGEYVNHPLINTDIVAFGGSATTTAKYWFDPNTTTAYFRGNVGIGTTSPTYALSVEGTSSLGSQAIAGSFIATSTVTNIFPNLVAINATTTNATSTNLAITGLASTLLKVNGNGSVIPAVAGTDYVATTTGNWSGTFAGQSASYYLNANNLTNFGAPFYTLFHATTTDALAEGSTNLYFTQPRFDTAFSAKTTTNLAEGSNLYYTPARFDTRFVTDLSATTSVSSITMLPNLSLPASQVSGFGSAFYTYFNATTTDALAQGSVNKYYADSLVNAYLNASTTVAKTYSPNTWSGLQTFNYSSSTIYSSFATASTTNLIVNGQSFNNLLGSGLVNTSGALSVSGLTTANLASANISQFTNNSGYLTSLSGAASSTLLADSNTFTGKNTFAQATSSSFAITGLASTLLKVNGNGSVIPAVAGTDYQAAGSYLTALGSGYASTTNTAVTFSTTTLVFNGLTIGQTIVPSAGALLITPTLTGTLSNTGLANSTISGIALGSNLANLTATNGTLTFSGSFNGGTAQTVGLNLANANTWSATQNFANASTTGFSAQYATIGGTASTTFTSAGFLGVGTSTPWALLSVNPNGMGSGIPEFVVGSTSATHLLVDGGGKVGIGTLAPGRRLDVVDANSVAQLRLSQSTLVYGEIYADASGDVQISATGGNIRMNDDNLFVCSGGSCGANAPVGNGNIVVETAVIWNNNFKLKQIDASTTIMYDTTNTAILTFDESSI